MQKLTIGKWEITDSSINWMGVYGRMDYSIPFSQLNEEKDGMFEWILHTAGRSWIKFDDKLALIASISYAIEEYNIEIPEGISLSKTIREIF